MRAELLMFLFLLLLSPVFAQQQVRTYIVNYKGDDIGTIRLQQQVNGDTVNYKMSSDIKTRFIFTIHVKSFEESMFKNGRLIFSTVNRTVNGDEKVKRHTRAASNSYTLTNGERSVVLHNESIGYNLMRMYCVEPVNINRVYSDNYQKFLPVTKIRQHTYKVELPDGNYNYYSYTNGICTKVEVFNTMYKMEMNLK